MGALDVNQAKSELRSRVLANRERGHDCGHSHSQLLIDYCQEQRAMTVACFISFGDEPNTNVFIKHCQLHDKVKLFVPRVSGEDLEWVLFTDEQARHPLGMQEPLGDAVSLKEVDLMVIPALAVDRTGNRLGRGRGFYDRALKAISAKQIVVVVHDDEVFDSVPVEGHDHPATAICTCSSIIEL